MTSDMKRYIEGCIEDFKEEVPELVLKNVATPATEHLFKIRNKDEVGILTRPKAVVFHVA